MSSHDKILLAKRIGLFLMLVGAMGMTMGGLVVFAHRYHAQMQEWLSVWPTFFTLFGFLIWGTFSEKLRGTEKEHVRPDSAANDNGDGAPAVPATSFDVVDDDYIRITTVVRRSEFEAFLNAQADGHGIESEHNEYD